MSLPRPTAIGLFLMISSLALSSIYLLSHPVFDIRLAASVIALVSYLILVFEFKKHAGKYQLFGILFSMLALGLSLDRSLPMVPYISVALFASFLTYRKFFRRWFSETTLMGLDPFFVLVSFSIYVFGNLQYEYGWKGWLLPVGPLAFNAFLTLMDFAFSTKTLKYISEKKLVHEVGKQAPDFCLPDFDGKEVKLSDFIGRRNVLIMFVRNAWCPSCHIMLRTYQKSNEKFKEKDVMLFAIGPDASEVNKRMALDMGIDFRVLSDATLSTAKAYRVHLTSEVVGEQMADGMALPASFLICKKGIIRYSSRPDKIGEFFSPETIFPILESLN